MSPENEPLVELTRDPLNRSWVLVVSQEKNDEVVYVTVRIPDYGSFLEWQVHGPVVASDHTELTARI